MQSIIDTNLNQIKIDGSDNKVWDNGQQISINGNNNIVLGSAGVTISGNNNMIEPSIVLRFEPGSHETINDLSELSRRQERIVNASNALSMLGLCFGGISTIFGLVGASLPAAASVACCITGNCVSCCLGGQSYRIGDKKERIIRDAMNNMVGIADEELARLCQSSDTPQSSERNTSLQSVRISLNGVQQQVHKDGNGKLTIRRDGTEVCTVNKLPAVTQEQVGSPGTWSAKVGAAVIDATCGNSSCCKV